jgi:hypothetical protein
MGIFDFKCKASCTKACKQRFGNQKLYETICTVRFLIGEKMYTTTGVYSGYGWVDIFPKLPKQIVHAPTGWMEKGDGGWAGEAGIPDDCSKQHTLHLKEFAEYFDGWGDVHHIAESADCWECCSDFLNDEDCMEAFLALTALGKEPNVDWYLKKEDKKPSNKAIAAAARIASAAFAAAAPAAAAPPPPAAAAPPAPASSPAAVRAALDSEDSDPLDALSSLGSSVSCMSSKEVPELPYTAGRPLLKGFYLTGKDMIARAKKIDAKIGRWLKQKGMLVEKGKEYLKHGKTWDSMVEQQIAGIKASAPFKRKGDDSKPARSIHTYKNF